MGNSTQQLKRRYAARAWHNTLRISTTIPVVVEEAAGVVLGGGNLSLSLSLLVVAEVESDVVVVIVVAFYQAAAAAATSAVCGSKSLESTMAETKTTAAPKATSDGEPTGKRDHLLTLTAASIEMPSMPTMDNSSSSLISAPRMTTDHDDDHGHKASTAASFLGELWLGWA